MAKQQQSGSGSGGSGGAAAAAPKRDVTNLIHQAQSTLSEQQESLVEARQRLVEQVETSLNQLAQVDTTLESVGYDGDLVAPDISVLEPYGVGIQSSSKSSSGRRGRSSRSSQSSNGTSSSGRTRPKNEHKLADCIVLALRNVARGRAGGDGMGPQDIAEAVQKPKIGYHFSSPENAPTLVNQRLTELKSLGYVKRIDRGLYTLAK